MKNRIIPTFLSGLLGLAAALTQAGPARQKPIAEEIAVLLAETKPRRGPAGTARQATEASRSWTAGDGFLTYAGAPPGHHFTVEAGAVGGPPKETIARNFLRQQGRLFGVTSDSVNFTVANTRTRPGRTNLRLQQTYAGVPIVAALVMVQVNEEGGVDAVLSAIARDTAPLDAGKLSLQPTLSPQEAAARVRDDLEQHGAREVQTQAGELKLFAPAVVDAVGPIRLVWEWDVSGTTKDGFLHQRVLVDAHTAEVVRRFTLIHSALNRRVHDANCTQRDPGTLVRPEGQAPSGIAEADDAYDYLGDTYDFYFNQHGRDSIDDLGMTLDATVRFAKDTACTPPDGLAYYSALSNRIYYGRGYVTDDVTAHELTHGVTGHTSGLIYQNDAGAIDEAFSDIWGEFVDLGNGRGTDTAAVRWLMGEDLPKGALRNMTNPPALGHPDRYGSPLYVVPPTMPSDKNDWGGVHANSGIINKLCVLLTEGATFNGLTIQGYGIPRVAALFYEVNTALLTSGANYQALFNALRQAAVNLGWNANERLNLLRACVAVEIGGVYVDGARSCFLPDGSLRCRLLGGGPYLMVTDGVRAVLPGEYLGIISGTYNESLTGLKKAMTIRALNGPVTIGR